MTLQAFGVDPSVAASYTFTLHAALWVPVTLLGGYFFWRNHLHMSDIAATRQQEEQEAGEAVQTAETPAAPAHGELQQGITASDGRGTPSRARGSPRNLKGCCQVESPVYPVL